MEKNQILSHENNAVWLENNNRGPIKAVVIVLHGLNLKPEKMDDWAHMLSKQGAMVLRLGLSGHNGSVLHMKAVSGDDWRKNFSDQVENASLKAQSLGVPLYFLGFSLGALVGLEWLANKAQDTKSFDKMVLIAPAISLPWYAKGVKFFSIFGPSFMLPSRSPKAYQANPGVSVAAYEALFSLKEGLEKAEYHSTNIDTLLIMDRHDELVSSLGVSEIIKKYHLSRWHLKIIDNKFAEKNFGFRHLLVDENSVGKELWQDITKQVINHFALLP